MKRLGAVVFSGLLFLGCTQEFSVGDRDDLFQWCTEHSSPGTDCGAAVGRVQKAVDAKTTAGDLRYDEGCIVREAKTYIQREGKWSKWSCGPPGPSWVRRMFDLDGFMQELLPTLGFLGAAVLGVSLLYLINRADRRWPASGDRREDHESIDEGTIASFYESLDEGDGIDE